MGQRYPARRTGVDYDGPTASEIWTRPGEARRTGTSCPGRCHRVASHREPDDWEIALVETLPRRTRRSARKAELESRQAGWARRRSAGQTRPDKGGLDKCRPAKGWPRRLDSCKAWTTGVALARRPRPGHIPPAGNAKLEDAARAYLLTATKMRSGCCANCRLNHPTPPRSKSFWASVCTGWAGGPSQCATCWPTMS